MLKRALRWPSCGVGGGPGVGREAVISAGIRRTKTVPRPGALSTVRAPPISLIEAESDRQAEAGAAVAARGRGVGLLEGLEDAG